jgi:hypothetical protein
MSAGDLITNASHTLNTGVLSWSVVFCLGGGAEQEDAGGKNAHWAELVKIAAHNLKPGDQVRRDIENLQVRRASEDLLLQLTPIDTALGNMQQECVSLADATKEWLQVLNSFPKDNFKGAYKKVVERAKLCLDNPAFLAAYLMHHAHIGRDLTPDQVTAAIGFIQVLSPLPQTASLPLFFSFTAGQRRGRRCDYPLVGTKFPFQQGLVRCSWGT